MAARYALYTLCSRWMEPHDQLPTDRSTWQSQSAYMSDGGGMKGHSDSECRFLRAAREGSESCGLGGCRSPTSRLVDRARAGCCCAGDKQAMADALRPAPPRELLPAVACEGGGVRARAGLSMCASPAGAHADTPPSTSLSVGVVSAAEVATVAADTSAAELAADRLTEWRTGGTGTSGMTTNSHRSVMARAGAGVGASWLMRGAGMGAPRVRGLANVLACAAGGHGVLPGAGHSGGVQVESGSGGGGPERGWPASAEERGRRALSSGGGLPCADMRR
mmetsp:Transcript_52067/g.130763  ORF Transcript_52067/g.130763 Transcript_52067/m.130763 type:complete len:278 (-) Transcript_52067:750-1583(-)